MKDIYQTDQNGYPHGYIELYHRDDDDTTRLAVRGNQWHKFYVGYNEGHWDSPYKGIAGIVFYNIT